MKIRSLILSVLIFSSSLASALSYEYRHIPSEIGEEVIIGEKEYVLIGFPLGPTTSIARENKFVLVLPILKNGEKNYSYEINTESKKYGYWDDNFINYISRGIGKAGYLKGYGETQKSIEYSFDDEMILKEKLYLKMKLNVSNYSVILSHEVICATYEYDIITTDNYADYMNWDFADKKCNSHKELFDWMNYVNVIPYK